ncbi:hypothetical protein Q9L58_008039 [Maublancomyces gigas]|uniref:Uncharacterized protein n=1 Tax=Discina gigas TaxID=1032678 RepID=A0ABR3GB95_9PEZI
MWRLEPPHKKRRLSRTVSLDLYNLHGGHDTQDENRHLTPTPEAETQMDPEALLPLAQIPSVITPDYDEYLQSLPLNIVFQTRIINSQLTTTMYPAALVGVSVRLYYPDHRNFNSLLHDGIIPMLGVVQRDAIRTLKIVLKKEGEIVFVSEFICFEEQWEVALAELRKKGVGRRGGEGGRNSADSVRLLVGLDCETY